MRDRECNALPGPQMTDALHISEDIAQSSRLLRLPAEIRLIIYEMICHHGVIEVESLETYHRPDLSIYKQPRLEGSVILHICQQICYEALPIFYKLTTFDVGSLWGENIRQILDTETCNSVQLIKVNVPNFRKMLWVGGLSTHISPYQSGVVLPSIKRVSAVIIWQRPETKTEVDFILTTRVIDIGKCDQPELEETGLMAVHAEYMRNKVNF